MTAGGGPAQPSLSVTDVSVTEGDAGVATAHVVVRLTSPAGPGGVTFDVATADGTALAANSDYVPLALAAQAIAEGATEAAIDVSVVGDMFSSRTRRSRSSSATSPARSSPTTPPSSRSSTTTCS